MNGFSSTISLFRGSGGGTEETSSRAQAPPLLGGATKNGSAATLNTQAPPPTPDYLPPPPLPPPGASTTSASQAPAVHPPPTPEFLAPPPTPDFVPPPPMPPSAPATSTTSTIDPISRPTPEHVPLPFSPPRGQQQPPQRNVPGVVGLVRNDVMVAGIQAKTASPLVCNKRLHGHNGFGYAGNDTASTFRSDGMTSSGSSGSLSSPPNYCSPPQSEDVSSKRPRLGYGGDNGHLVR